LSQRVGQRRPGVPHKKIIALRHVGTSLPYLIALALVLLSRAKTSPEGSLDLESRRFADFGLFGELRPFANRLGDLFDDRFDFGKRR
ncbi:MAG: hypothetical protein OSB19_12785, partial [Opitutaceae bacterium]|nr:hypothetical protein [Opitutaceae bacterium]